VVASLVIVVVSGKVGFEVAVPDMLDMPDTPDVVGVSVVSSVVGLVGLPVVVCTCPPELEPPLALAVPATSSPPQADNNEPTVTTSTTLANT